MRAISKTAWVLRTAMIWIFACQLLACGPAQFGSHEVQSSAGKNSNQTSQPTSGNSITAATPAPASGGVCGRAHNSYPDPLTGPNSTDLCAKGSSAGLVGAGPWSWQCIGLNGGASVNCGTLSCETALRNAGVVHVSYLCNEYQVMFRRLPDIAGALYWDVDLFQRPTSCMDVAFLAGTQEQDCARYFSIYGQPAPAAVCGGIQPTTCP